MIMQQAATPMNRQPVGSDARSHLAALADQCVKCGLCQPVCPTYRIGRSEAESPRGRIAFAQALAGGRLAATPSLIAHLDHCLACLGCERVCPSQVRYGELIVGTRALLRESRRPARFERWLHALLLRPRWLRAALLIANFSVVRSCMQSSIAQAALRPFGLDRVARELPHASPAGSVPESRRPTSPRGRVGLFLGCVAATVERDVHAGAMRLLQALGYEVVVPPGQGCCGALALHAGDIGGADAAAAPTRRAFADAGVDTLLVSASGCFATLRDTVFAGTQIRVRDIHEFIDDDAHRGELKFRALDCRVALHTPCTQTNVARAGDAVRRLLQKIPQVEIVDLPAEPGCCGAAGDYFLRHAEIADALRAEKVDQVEVQTPDVLVTSNVGCRVFLDNGLRQRGKRLPVTHAVALLAQQLDN
ncbi:MAG: (Fe-S)-binding protein [Rudaea sp.]|nr:(Fe-S)-binding protein [Rudaea sp.]